MTICKIEAINSSGQYLSGEGVLLKHIYVANTTLIKLNSGTLIIQSNNKDVLTCTGKCLILIEKHQTLSINCNDVNNNLEIKLIDIPYSLIIKMYSMYIAESKLDNTINMQGSISSRMLCSVLHPGMNEAFDSVFNCLQKAARGGCGDCVRCYTETDGSRLDFTLMFLLSAFTFQVGGIGTLTRAVRSSMRERLFNIIMNDLSRAWTLDDVAANLYISSSTLKRKLALEDTSFSKIYLDARMSLAKKLLYTGGHNISQVSVLCGYNNPSYFITSFKKYFQMTPHMFMKLTNH